MIASASSNEKLEFCKSLGADFVVNYKETPEFDKEIIKITNGRGCQVIADPVGAPNALRNIASCGLDARWVLYGFLGGRVIP